MQHPLALACLLTLELPVATHVPPAQAAESALQGNAGQGDTAISGYTHTPPLLGQTVPRQVSYSFSKGSPVGPSKRSSHPCVLTLSFPASLLVYVIGWRRGDTPKTCGSCLKSLTQGWPWKTAVKENVPSGQNTAFGGAVNGQGLERERPVGSPGVGGATQVLK